MSGSGLFGLYAVGQFQLHASPALDVPGTFSRLRSGSALLQLA